MLPPSIWNSEAALSNVTFWVNVIGGTVTLVTAAITFITAFRETTSRRKKHLERLVAVLTLLLAILCGFNVFAAERQGDLSDARLAGAEEATTALQRAQAPRQITPAQEEIFIKKCKLLAPGESVVVEYVVGDSEIFNFAKQINDLLRKAGFSVLPNEHMPSMMPFGPPVTGLTLRVASQENPPVHTLVLQRAFSEIGLDAPASVGVAPGKESAVFVLVGAKSH